MIGALAVGSTKARLAGYDNFVILNHHEEPHGFFLDYWIYRNSRRVLFFTC